jgi:Leucine-rich repeat (LRR) protein
MKNLFQKILLLALLVAGSNFTAQAQYVTIPDANFRAFLQQSYPTCFNAQGQMDTTCNEVTTTTMMNCGTRSISNLDGVQYFDALRDLSCEANQLIALPRLPSTLISLHCAINNLTSLPALPSGMLYFNCYNNQITSLPVLPSGLTDLYCNANHLASLPALPSSLTTLYCSTNRLTNLPALPSNLTHLYCSANLLTNLPALPNGLIRLECAYNQLGNLPLLPTTLQNLICSANQLTSLPVLPNSLITLISDQNQLSSLPTLPPALMELNCSNNQLTNLPVLPNTLTELNCSNNQLTNLPTLPVSLSGLHCINNQLTSLPLLPSNLTALFCGNNQITNLPTLASLGALTHLFCSDNPLSCLPFLPNTLPYLDVSNTNIACLPNIPLSLQNPTLPLCLPNNPNGCFAAARIFGKIYIDSNNNCTIEAADSTQKNILVRAVDNATQTVYVGTSNAQGDYEIAVPVGTFSVIVLPPSNYWTACGAAQTVVITQDGQQEQRDVLLKPEIPCASMEIDHQAGIMRPCSTATLTMTYFNKGTIPSAGTYANLELPAELTFVSASLPATPLGNNHFRINIGNVGVLERNTFTVNVTVNCSVLMNQILCSHIEVLPNSYCSTAATASWDGSDVSLSGRCIGNNQVRFIITNSGNSPMTTAQNYYIVEDNVMVRSSAFQLLAGASDSVTITADPSKIYRMIATETPNIPAQNLQETFLVWGCNGSNTGIHWGFVNQYALNTGDVHEHDLCINARTSFDPNDISAVAEGVGAQHFIPKNSELEYRIRFQNTGNDTAFVVRVLDKIPAELDLTTLRIGSASHPMTYSLKANGTLEFLFQNILLEDSTSNEAKSHGFVTYKIKTKANIVTGATIQNQAFIYFDANPPVATNIYTHTIGENLNTIFISTLQVVDNQQFSVSVRPNPMHDAAVFVCTTDRNSQLGNRGGDSQSPTLLTLYNTLGQAIKTQSFIGETLVLQRDDLPQGCYFYKITNGGASVAQGKLVVE